MNSLHVQEPGTKRRPTVAEDAEAGHPAGRVIDGGIRQERNYLRESNDKARDGRVIGRGCLEGERLSLLRDFGFGGFGPLLRGEMKEHSLFEFVRAFRLIGVIADENFVGEAVVGGDEPK
jgi:hypothetical protein